MIHFAHVGIQKTGSTWLQTGLFSHHPDLEVMGGNIRDHQLCSLLKELTIITQGNPLRGEWFSEFEDGLTRLQKRKNSRRDNSLVGLSNENLAGHIYDSSSSEMIAQKLNEFFGGIKIILVLRHPLSFLSSAYNQGVRYGTITDTVYQFLSHPQNRQNIASRINYRILINTYQTIFGVDRVLILPYELLNECPVVFMRHITSFLGVDVSKIPTDTIRSARKNQSLSEPAMIFLRNANRLDKILIRLHMDNRKRRLFNRSAKRIIRNMPMLHKMPPHKARVTSEYLQTMPEYRCVLFDDNYRIWSGDLERYNYVFERFPVQRSFIS